MKNLTSAFLAIMLVFSALVLPSSRVYAQANTQNTASLEIQLYALQKELIVLLDKRVAMLQAEWRLMVEQKLKNLQIQLIGLLEKQISNLQSQLVNK